MPGADCGSDHNPVIGTMRLKLKKAKRAPKLQMNLLQCDQGIKGNYKISIENKFETLDQMTNAEEMWQMMKASVRQQRNIFLSQRENKTKNG